MVTTRCDDSVGDVGLIAAFARTGNVNVVDQPILPMQHPRVGHKGTREPGVDGSTTYPLSMSIGGRPTAARVAS